MKDQLDIKSLNGLGLTNYETKVYLALLDKKQLTAAEIARLADVPRSRVYDNLRLLESKGLCQIISDKIKLYSAANPSQFKEAMMKIEENRTNLKIEKIKIEMLKEKEKYEAEIQKEKDRLVEKAKYVEDIVDVLLPVYEKSRENESDIDYIEIIKDSALVHSKVCELIAEAKTEIIGFSKPPYSIVEKLPEQTSYSHVALNKGISIRNIFEIPKDKLELKHVIREIENSLRKGEQIKVMERVPLKFIIFDAETVIYSLDDPLVSKSSVTASLINHKNLAELFKTFFELKWNEALDPEILQGMI